MKILNFLIIICAFIVITAPFAIGTACYFIPEYQDVIKLILEPYEVPLLFVA